MKNGPGQGNLEVSPSGEYRVDQCSTEFEKAWQSAKRERIEDWLPRVPQPDQSRLLYELILVEVELRRAAGESPQADEYRQSFRDQSEIVDLAFAVLGRPLESRSQALTEVAPDGQDVGGGDLAAQGAMIGAAAHPEAITGNVRPGSIAPWDVLGDFRILRELGRGGMGIVYEAVQISLGRHVALKTLPNFGAIDSRSSRRFQNEARAAALLDHQNIVRVHAVGFDCGVHYYAMQLINGTDLGQVIKALRETVSESLTGGTSTADDDTSRREDTHSGSRDTCTLFGLSDPSATPANHQYVKTFARLGIQAAEALQHAHVTGIVHRDIKPSNLLLDTDGNIRVTDFGLAQIQGELGVSATGDIVGTLRYMSPEQAYAKRVIVDHRTDIYSLGVTLYELLTLQRAFEGANRAELLRKIAFEDPRPPRRLNSRIPIELETIVMKAMAKNPDQRYQSAGELADDLRRFDNSEPIRAQPPSPLDYAKKWCSRHRPLVGSLAAALSIVFVASVVSSGVVWFALQRTQAALESEQNQRKQTVRLWRKAEGLRLAALSALLRPKNPGLAFATAAEGFRLYPHRDLKSALLSAYESNYEHRTLAGHKGPVGSVSFDNEGEKLVTTVGRTQFGHAPEPARIWNVATGELLIELNSGTPSLTSAVFSPGGVRILATSAPIAFQAAQVDGTDPRHQPTIWDSLTGKKLMALTDSYLFDAHRSVFDPTGQRVVTPAAGNTAKIWDVLEGRVLFTLSGHTKRVIFAAFDAGGERVATVADDRTVRIWRARDGELLLELANWSQPGREPILAAFSPDGTTIATETTQDGIQIWNCADGTRVNDENWPGISPHFSPDGDRLAYTRYLDTQIRRVSDGQVLHEFPGQLAALSPDGSLVATVAGLNVTIWNADSGARLANLSGHSNDLATAAFDKSSRFLATGSYDRTARLWNVKSGAERLAYDASPLVYNPIVAENKVATRVAVATSPQVRNQLIDLATDRPVVDVPGAIWNPDVRGGRLLTTSGNRARVYDVQSGEKIADFEESAHALFVTQLSYDGQRALIVADRGPSWLWQIETNQRMQLVGREAAVLELDWSLNSEFAVACSEDGTVRIWDARTGMPRRVLRHPHAVIHVRVHPDCNRLAAVMSNDEGVLWDLASGEQLAALRPVAGIPFGRVEFSASGERIFGFREESSQGVLCWDAKDGALVGSVSPVRGRVRIATSPAGARIVIASSVDGAMVWDPAGERQVLTDAPTAYGAFLSDDQVVLATLGLNRNPESLRLDERRKFATPALEVRNSGDGKLVRQLASPIGWSIWLSVTPDRQRVLISGAYYGISIFNADSHELVASMRGHGAPLSFIGFADDAVVTTSWDGSAAVWEADSGALRRRLNSGRPVSAAAVSSDSTRLAVGDAVGNVHVWMINDDKPRVDLKPHGDLVKVVAYKPDTNDHLLTSSFDKTTMIRQRGGAVTQSIELGGAVIGRIRFAEDSKKWLLVPTNARIIEGPTAEMIEAHAADSQRKPVQDVSVYTDESVLHTFDAKSIPVDAAFRANGRELVTIGSRHIIVWDLDQRRPLREIELSGEGVDAGGVSSDGKLVVTEHRDRVSLWDLDTLDEIMTVTPVNSTDSFRETHFDPTARQILTIAGRQLKSYPIRESVLIEQSPRRLTPSERRLYGILDEQDWPKE